MATVSVETPAPLTQTFRSAPKGILNVVYNTKETAAAFDVQSKTEEVEGESPFAEDSEKKGPSIIEHQARQRTSGKLDEIYKFTEETPEIGRTYHDIDLVDVLADDTLIRDLAITIAERGVVFFRNQNNLSVQQQKELIDKLGKLTGKPSTSGLHIHPTQLSGGLLVGDKIDPEISVISSVTGRKLYQRKDFSTSRFGRGTFKTGWHSDITFEPVPSDFTSLRIIETPSGNPTEAELAKVGGGSVGGSGGDTLWASGYGLAERISPSLLAFLETLTGEYNQPVFGEALKEKGIPVYSAPRGAPENVGDNLKAYHPVVRTNPVTGWKSIFGIGEHFNRFVGLTQSESDILRDYLVRVLISSPEIHVRFKWSAGDIAIWDNRSNYHSIINDVAKYDPYYIRTGIRVVGIGERPYLDPKSTLRHEDKST